MDGISNIFKGKVMGSESTHTPQESIQELNVVKKIKALEEGHMRNLSENHKMKMFGLTQKMKGFNTIKPANTFQHSTDKLRAMGIIGSSEIKMSTTEMHNYKNQEKMQTVNARTKLENLGIFPNIQSVKKVQFSELIPRTQSLNDIRGDAFNRELQSWNAVGQKTNNKLGATFNQELQSWKTIGQRRGLQPFGDADRDGVPNWLDCKPLDRKKQGWLDENGIYHDDTGTVTGMTGFENTSAMVQNPGMQVQTTIEPQVKVSETDPNLRQKIISSVSNLYQKTGIPTRYQAYQENKKVREEWEKEIRKKAMEAAAEKGYELKGQQIYDQQVRKTYRDLGVGAPRMRQTVPIRQGLRQADAALRMGSRDISMGYDAAVNPLAKQRIRELTGLGGSPNTIKGILSIDNAGLPLYVKVDEWYGKGEKAQRYYENAPAIQRATPTPVMAPPMPTQYYPSTTQSYAQPVSQQPGPILSPYSKRRVQYTRGPYRSHKMAVQPQSQY